MYRKMLNDIPNAAGTAPLTPEMGEVRRTMLCSGCGVYITRLDMAARRCMCCGRALEDRHYVGWARLGDLGDTVYNSFVGCSDRMHTEFVGGDTVLRFVGRRGQELEVPTTSRIADAVNSALAHNRHTTLPNWWEANVYAGWLTNSAAQHVIIVPSRMEDCEAIFEFADEAGVFWKKCVIDNRVSRSIDPKRRKFITPKRRGWTRWLYGGVIVDAFNWSKIAGRVWPQKSNHDVCVQLRREDVYSNDNH